MWEEQEDCLREYRSICAALNLDKASVDEAWRNYSAVKISLSLEGDQRPWIGCAIYLACRSARVNTVGRPSVALEGNLVSLAGLLRHCDLSVLDFFKKCKKWMEWSESSAKMKARLEHLERKFTVSMVVFLKYRPIFIDMFKEPVSNSPPSKSKKPRNQMFTTTKLFDFCWTLFLCLKSRVPIVAEDLVNSLHLLLATCDLVYANVLVAYRRDLLNPEFPGLPENYMDERLAQMEKPPCIVDILCRRHNGLSLEAQFAKTYCLRPQINSLLRSNTLFGQRMTPESLLHPNHFENNFKAVDSTYQEYVVSVGDFDERIFLSEDANDDIGTRARPPETRDDTILRRDPSTHNVLITPLSGRDFLKDKDSPSKSQTPLSSVTAAVRNLMHLISGRSLGKPSDALLQKFKSLSPKLDKEISDRLILMGDLFIQASMMGQVPGHDATAFFRRRLEFATTLYYRVLEKIISREQADLTELLNQDLIHRSVFACCLEIVMFSYNAQRPFPWVEDTLHIDPYQFYRIIEITLRADDGFSSNVIKYLQTIEERVLDSYAWRSSSPLWESISASLPVPKCNEVSYTHQLLNEEEMKESTPPSSQGVQLVDRFGSPVKSLRPGQSVLANNYKGVTKAEPVSTDNENRRPTRSGSLALFFRKFYFLANLRMQDLCHRLDIRDLSLRRKIWTCFEYSIVNNTELMRDRHLDQILMCAVYVMCRVLHTPEQPTQTQFTDILKVYRNQPQATSAVYRNVLLTRQGQGEEDQENTQETRGNLIQFYNNVYMHFIQSHAREYATTEPRDNTRNQTLSPLPRIRHPAPSPVKNAQNSPHRRVFMTNMQLSNTSFDDIGGNAILIHSSPAKDLDEINEKISQCQPRIPVKRILGDSDSGPPPKKSNAIYMKMANVIKERSKQ